MMIRVMEPGDIASGLALCRSAGWNQLSRDWEIFLRLNPEGNRVCIIDDQVVGTVATMRYGDRFSWIGMVLVDPSYRRRGIGLKLLGQAQDFLNHEASVKLDATPEGKQVYRKLGFNDECELARMVSDDYYAQHLKSSPAPAPLKHDDIGRVTLFDLEVFGADRSALLSWMLEGAPDLAFKCERGGQLMGYCFGRPGYNYTQIGPLVASSIEVAKSLVQEALQQCGGNPVIMDVPYHDPSWNRWLHTQGFTLLRPFTRMYTGNNLSPGIPENQFAILGPEFG